MKPVVNPHKKRLRAVLLAAIIIGSAAALAVAEDQYVQPDQLDVREGPGLLFDPVDTVKKNVKLQILERTDDGWAKVQTPSGKQCYVFQKELGQQPAAGPGLLSGLNVTSDAEASQMSTGAASKGLEPEAETYARNKNYSKASLDQVMAMNKSVKGRQWMQFCQDGKVGPAKPHQK
jgi:uncharacterized protein YgiM (DUF1202 family)